MSLTRSILVLLSAAAIVACSAVPVLAAPASWESVEVSVHDDQGAYVLLVGGKLPESVALPAEVELSAPKGSELMWAGEVLGGDPSADPEVAVTTRTVGDHDVYSFTLTTTRSGQLEFTVPDVAAFDGSAYVARLTWLPTSDVGELAMSVPVPSTSRVIEAAEGATLVEGPGGTRYYRRIIEGAEGGQPVELAFTYSAPTATTGSSSTPGSNSGTLVVVIALSALFFGGIAVYLRRSSRARAPEAEEPTEARDADVTAASQGQDDSDADASEQDAPPASGGGRRARLIGAGVVALLIAGAVYAASAGSKPHVQGDRIVREFLIGDPCATVAVPLAGDPAGQADTIMTALQGAGVMRAEIVPAEGRVEVAFCDSQTSEEAIRAALAQVGALGE